MSGPFVRVDLVAMKQIKRVLCFASATQCRIAVNDEPRGWRDRVGDLLRAAAQKIDGRLSAGLTITTAPKISDEKVFECLNRGLIYARELLNDEVRSEANEHILQAGWPELHADKKTGDRSHNRP